jgi:hypothetical protein
MVAHPGQLYQRLMEGLAQAGKVHEPEGGFVQEAAEDMCARSALLDDAAPGSSARREIDMPRIASHRGAKASLVVATAGSLMATSQRRRIAYVRPARSASPAG